MSRSLGPSRQKKRSSWSKPLPPDKLAAKKDEIKHIRDVAKYLVRCKVIPADDDGLATMEDIIKEHNWDKK